MSAPKPIRNTILGVITGCLMAFTINTAPATALESDGFQYYEDGGKAIVTGCSAECADLLMFPVSVAGLEIKSIGGDAYLDGPQFTSVNEITFAEGSKVESIGDQAFMYAMELTSITLPSSIKSIGDLAFSQTGLLTIDLPEGLKSIGAMVFERTSLQSISIPSTVEFIGTRFIESSSVSQITVAKANLHYKVVDGMLLTKNGKTLVTYSPRRTSSVVRVPLGVELIQLYAFYGSLMEYVLLPSSVSLIEEGAFALAENLVGVNFESENITLTVNTFYNAPSLKWLIFKGHKPSLPDGSGTFNGAVELTIYFNPLIADGTEWEGEFVSPQFGVPQLTVRPIIQQVSYSPTLLPSSKARVVGTAKIGKKLVVSAGEWRSSIPVSFTYQWYSCSRTAKSATVFTNDSLSTCKIIKNATRSSLKISKNFKGKYLRARITAKGLGSLVILSASSPKVR